jgi:hypothetical protein
MSMKFLTHQRFLMTFKNQQQFEVEPFCLPHEPVSMFYHHRYAPAELDEIPLAFPQGPSPTRKRSRGNDATVATPKNKKSRNNKTAKQQPTTSQSTKRKQCDIEDQEDVVERPTKKRMVVVEVASTIVATRKRSRTPSPVRASKGIKLNNDNDKDQKPANSQNNLATTGVEQGEPELSNFHIEGLGTSQGQEGNWHSINACTVIATTVAAQHLHVDNANQTHPSTGDLKCIIDNWSGPLAEEIREHCGEDEFSMLEQYQVAEYFTEQLGMFPAQAMCPVGGNVMETTSRDNVWSQMESSTGKAAATLCFGGHAVAILRCCDPSSGRVWYEWIDSAAQETGEYNGQGVRCHFADVKALDLFLQAYCRARLPEGFNLTNTFDSNVNDCRMFQALVWQV